MKRSHSQMLFDEAVRLIKSMGLTGQIQPSELVNSMAMRSLAMPEALRLLLAQRGLNTQ